MGRGGAKAAAAGALAALALIAAGCGAQSHPNEPRPAVPTRVSVTLSQRGLVVQPPRIAFGPEKRQQIPQNQNHAQPAIETDQPLDVIFVIANQTRHDTVLRLQGPKDEESAPILASSPGTFQTSLPSGRYSLRAQGVAASGDPTLAVGPYRASSQNDVLLP